VLSDAAPTGGFGLVYAADRGTLSVDADGDGTPEARIDLDGALGPLAMLEASADAEGGTEVALAARPAMLVADSGFFRADASYAAAIEGPADVRWYQIYDPEADTFVTEGAESVARERWVEADSLAEMPLQEGRFWVRSWGPESGFSDWGGGRVTTGGPDSRATVVERSFAPEQEVALAELIGTTELPEAAYVRVTTEQRDFGWLRADGLAETTFDTGAEAGDRMAVWVDTYLEGAGRSGWSRTTVTTTTDLDTLGGRGSTAVTTDAGTGGFAYTDAAGRPSHTEILTFGADDSLTITGAAADDITLAAEDGDTVLRLGGGDEPASTVRLVGVTAPTDSLATFNAREDLGDVLIG
jgi:hypothetical protein